jgi:hypothetical protein
MKRIILLVLIGVVVLGAWAWAREQVTLNRSTDYRMQEMQDASCSPTNNPPGGG